MTTVQATAGPHEWVPGFDLGDRLRIVRRAKRRTQDEMAALLGVKKATYGAWEVGRNTPSLREVQDVARRLYMLDGVPEWWTLGAQEPSNRAESDGRYLPHPEERVQSGGRAADNLAARTRSSTDRASDYGSAIGHSSPFRRRIERRKRMGVVPLRLVRESVPA